SAPLTATGPALATNDKGMVAVYLATTAGANFTVAVGASFRDHDPATGVETVIVTAGSSNCNPPTNGTSKKCSSQSTNLPAAYTVPSGHVVKVTVTITPLSGSGSGTFIYNGNDTSSGGGNDSVASLPSTNSVTWPFGKYTQTITFAALAGKTFGDPPF